MQHFKALKKIFLLFFLVLFVFGCATSRNSNENADFGLTAEIVPRQTHEWGNTPKNMINLRPMDSSR